jgi:hypothetical protein
VVWEGQRCGAQVSAGRPPGSWCPSRGAGVEGTWAPLQSGGSRPLSQSQLDHPTLQSRFPRGLSYPPACGLGVSLKSWGPWRDPAPAAASPPLPAGVPRSHLGAGAGPAHRPEQQERQAQRAGGAGHGGALRTGPSLPPAEPRAETDPRRAAGAGGGAGAGPPRLREGPGGVRCPPPRCPRPASRAGMDPALRSPRAPLGFSKRRSPAGHQL